MTQSKGPLTTSFWFQVHISYGFGGDSRTKSPKVPLGLTDSRTDGRVQVKVGQKAGVGYKEGAP